MARIIALVSECDYDQTTVKKIIDSPCPVECIERRYGIGAALVNVLVTFAGEERAKTGREDDVVREKRPILKAKAEIPAQFGIDLVGQESRLNRVRLGEADIVR